MNFTNLDSTRWTIIPKSLTAFGYSTDWTYDFAKCVNKGNMYINCQSKQRADLYSIVGVMAMQIYGLIGHHQICKLLYMGNIQ